MIWSQRIVNWPSILLIETRLEIGVFDENLDKIRVVETASMPFLCCGLSQAFLRTAAAINHLGCALLKIRITSYFDDLTVLTHSNLARGTRLAVETVFDVIGVCLTKTEKES